LATIIHSSKPARRLLPAARLTAALCVVELIAADLVLFSPLPACSFLCVPSLFFVTFVTRGIRGRGSWWVGSERILADFCEAITSPLISYVVTHTEASPQLQGLQIDIFYLVRRVSSELPLIYTYSFWFWCIFRLDSVCAMQWWTRLPVRQWRSFSPPWAVKPKTTSSSTEHCVSTLICDLFVFVFVVCLLNCLHPRFFLWICNRQVRFQIWELLENGSSNPPYRDECHWMAVLGAPFSTLPANGTSVRGSRCNCIINLRKDTCNLSCR
jgi:hypothetical protein